MVRTRRDSTGRWKVSKGRRSRRSPQALDRTQSNGLVSQWQNTQVASLARTRREQPGLASTATRDHWQGTGTTPPPPHRKIQGQDQVELHGIQTASGMIRQTGSTMTDRGWLAVCSYPAFSRLRDRRSLHDRHGLLYHPHLLFPHLLVLPFRHVLLSHHATREVQSCPSSPAYSVSTAWSRRRSRTSDRVRNAEGHGLCRLCLRLSLRPARVSTAGRRWRPPPRRRTRRRRLERCLARPGVLRNTVVISKTRQEKVQREYALRLSPLSRSSMSFLLRSRSLSFSICTCFPNFFPSRSFRFSSLRLIVALSSSKRCRMRSMWASLFTISAK